MHYLQVVLGSRAHVVRAVQSRQEEAELRLQCAQMIEHTSHFFFFIYIYTYIYMYISSAATRHARSPGRQARAPDVSRERVCARAGTRGDVLLLSRCGLGYIIYSRPAENCRSTKFGAAERKIGAARRLRTQPPLIKSSRQIFLNQARSTWPYLARYFVGGPTRWGHELGYGLVD